MRRGYVWKRLLAYGLAIGAALLWVVSAVADDDHDRNAGRALVGTWSASPHLAGGFPVPFASGFSNQTIREIVHTSVGGRGLRVRLSNAFGTAPITFDAVFVGVQGDGANLVARSNRQVTFGSRPA